MSAYLIAFVGLIYLAVAISEWLHGHNSMACVFLGYALANIGLTILAL